MLQYARHCLALLVLAVSSANFMWQRHIVDLLWQRRGWILSQTTNGLFHGGTYTVVSSQPGGVLACVLLLTLSVCLRALSREWHSLVGWTEARYFLMTVKLSDGRRAFP